MTKIVVPPWITVRSDGGALIPSTAIPPAATPDLNAGAVAPAIPVQGLERVSRGGGKAGGVSIIYPYSLAPFDQTSRGGGKAGGQTIPVSFFSTLGGGKAGGQTSRVTPAAVRNSLGGGKAGGVSKAISVLTSRGGGKAGGVSIAGDQLLVYDVYQDSNYAGYSNLIGTYATLTNSDGTNGAATAGGSPSWIQATFTPGPKTVVKVKVAGGNMTNWGTVAAYLNGADIQYTTDSSPGESSSWSTLLTISGVDDTFTAYPAPTLFSFDITPTSCTALRLAINGYLATTEFQIFGY